MDVSPVGSGTIRINQTAPDSYPNNTVFSSGEYVRLEAVPISGYHFDSWEGDLSNSVNPAIIAMTCNKKVIAKFSSTMHTVTIETKGSGSTSPTEGVYTYAEGTVIDIIATPHTGWLFDGWTGTVSNADSAKITLTIDTDKIVVANFNEAGPNWWLVGGIVAGILVMVLIILLVFRTRAS